MTPFVRKSSKRMTQSANRSVRAEARDADRGAPFSTVSPERTGEPDRTEAVLKVLLAFVLIGTSAIVVLLFLELLYPAKAHLLALLASSPVDHKSAGLLFWSFTSAG